MIHTSIPKELSEQPGLTRHSHRPPPTPFTLKTQTGNPNPKSPHRGHKRHFFSGVLASPT